MDETGPTPKRHSVHRQARSKGFKKAIIWLGAVIIVAGIGYEGYRVVTKKSKPPADESVKSLQNPVVAPPPKDVPEAGTQKPFASSTLSLKLNYPDTWKLTETSDAGLRLESPLFRYVSADRGQVDGRFRVYIRKGARTIDSTIIGRGLAVEASQKIAYTQPATNQRKDTLLSQFGLDTTDTFSYFLIAGNFQLQKGDTLGPSYAKESDAYIIFGGYSDDTLKDGLATHSVAPALLTSSNAYKQALQIIASLQLN